MDKQKQISILCIEDGSVDLDELEESGLQDGKILVYRQGANPPFVLSMTIPENSVVLTEKAYSDLLSDEVDTIERDIAEYWATQGIKSVAKELHKDGYRKLDDHAILVLRKAKGLEEKVRKETAEKFAKMLKEVLLMCFENLTRGFVFKRIDEIAKEITEG